MKTMMAVFLSLAAGASLGLGVAFQAYSSPGPDLEWMRTAQPSLKSYADQAKTSIPPTELVQVVDGAEFDFGVMDRGATMNHTFLIRNNGQRPLELRVGETTCKCTVGELAENIVPPGETGEVKLEWTAKVAGTEFRQSATIHTSSSVRPTVLLSVFGEIHQMVEAVPMDVAFSDVTVRDERVGEFVLFSYEEDPLDIVEHRWTNPEFASFFEFSYEPTEVDPVAMNEDARSALRCLVTLKPGLPLGPVRQNLELVTSASRDGMLDIPVRVRVVGDIRLNGRDYNDTSNRWNLGPISQAEGGEYKLFLTVKGPYVETFTVEEAVAEPADIFEISMDEARSLRGGAVKMVPIHVRVPPGVRPVNFSGGDQYDYARITLHTNHPETPEIAFDVKLVVME